MAPSVANVALFLIVFILCTDAESPFTKPFEVTFSDRIRVKSQGSELASTLRRNEVPGTFYPNQFEFNITFSDQPEWNDPQYQQLQNVIRHAAHIWSSVIMNGLPVPLQVVVAQMQGIDPNILVSVQAYLVPVPWSDTQSFFQMVDPDPWANFSSNPVDIAVAMNWPEGFEWNGTVLATPVWAPVKEAPPITLLIQSSALPMYDLDPSDGSNGGKLDALTHVLHQLAFSFGLFSIIDFYPLIPEGTVSFPVSMWDLFRFNSSEPGDIFNATKTYDPLEPHHYYMDENLVEPIELSRGIEVSPFPAGGWLDANRTDVKGILDPHPLLGQQIGLSPFDLSALDTVGFNVSMVPELIIDGFTTLNSTSRTLKVLGFFFQNGSKCRFNESPSLTVDSMNDFEVNLWRGVTCPIPKSLNIGAQNITVSVSNDGEVFSPPIQFSSSKPEVIGVNTPNIPLINNQASLEIRSTYLDSESRYTCSVAGYVFDGQVKSSEVLICNLTFLSGNLPVSRQSYNLTVKRNGVPSNSLRVFFTYPPVIEGAQYSGKKVRLSGQHLTNGMCEFDGGAESVATLKGDSVTCAYTGPRLSKGSTLKVRLETKEGESNWFERKV